MSLKTVSRVINAEAGVTPATAAKVTEAIDALGFERNDLARSLRQGRTSSTLGLVIEDVANPFYSAVAQAVEAVASDRGFLLITASALEDAERERELIGALLRRRVDALLIVPAGPDHRYISSAARTVFLDRPPQGIAADTVLLDNLGGARRAVEHLIAHGHTRIACVADTADLYTMRERLDGLPRGAARRRARGGPGARRQRQPRRDRRAGRRRAPARPARRAPPDRDLRRQQPQHGRRAARARRAPADPSRWSASTTSSSPTCSAPPSSAPTPGASASRPRRSPSRASTATTGRRSRSRSRRELIVRGSGEVAAMRPQLLPPNQFHRFYRGGARIDALRGVPEGEDGRPEDWIGSTATSFGSDSEGLSRLEDGRVAARRDRGRPRGLPRPRPRRALGRRPRAAGQAARRRPAPARSTSTPAAAFAREHLGMRFGKTESWIILEAEPDAAVHVGPREPLDPATVRGWVDRQDADEMLAALQRRPGRRRRRGARAGRHPARDRRRHPAARAAGADRPVRARRVEAVRRDRRLGAPRARLGDGAAGDGHRARRHRRADRRRRATACCPTPPTPTSAPSACAAATSSGPRSRSCSCIGGEGALRSSDGDELELRRGTTALVPYAAGATTLSGDIEAIRCLPPVPTAGEGAW